MKILFTLLFTALTIAHAGATAQKPDRIIYEGKESNLHTNPMERYFGKHPDRKPQSEIYSTGLWREICRQFRHNKQLYATKKQLSKEQYNDFLRSFVTHYTSTFLE